MNSGPHHEPVGGPPSKGAQADHAPHQHPHNDRVHAPDDGHDHPQNSHEDSHGDHGHEHGDDGNEHHHSHDHSDHGNEHSRGIKGAILSLFRPHSHDAADSIDSTLEASKEGMQALKISLLLLLVTATFQVVIVIVSGSVALLADTIHNFGDALTAIPLAAAFWLSRRSPTKRYTYGYGRSEDLAGIFIVLTILASSVIAAWEAVNRFIHPQKVHQIPWVIAAGLVGFVGNEAVAQYRIRVGRRVGSAALEADGYHARTDGFTSLAVVVGAICVAAGWRLADPLVGLAITVAILVVVKSAARDVYHRLMDAVDPDLVDLIASMLLQTDGIDTVDSVRIRWIGHELNAEIAVSSDGSLNLVEAHAIAEHAEHELLHAVRRLTRVTIHTNPTPSDGINPHQLTDHHHE